MKKSLKIVLYIISILLILIIINYLSIIISYNIDKKEYKETIKIQGTTDNYIPQGLTYSDKYNVIIQSSYNKKHKISKIYITDFKTKKLIKELKLINIDNSINKSHVGGISTNNKKIWITNDYSIDEFDLDEIISTNNNYIKPINNIKIPIRGDFCTFHNNSLYIGEFYLNPFYKVKNKNPIMIKYNINNYEQEEIYSLPKMVQGLVITDNNEFIFTRSYSHFIRSYLNYYKKAETTDTFNNVPYYHFNNTNLIKKEKIPPMAEELFYKDNNLYILFESNSTRYFYAIPKIKKILQIKK